MCSLHTVQRALEGKLGTTTAAGSTADERKEQGEAADYVLRIGPSEGPGFRRELTRRGPLDRLDRSSNAYRAEDPFGGETNYDPVGFGSAEGQNYPDDDPMGESDFGVSKGVK